MPEGKHRILLQHTLRSSKRTSLPHSLGSSKPGMDLSHWAQTQLLSSLLLKLYLRLRHLHLRHRPTAHQPPHILRPHQPSPLPSAPLKRPQSRLIPRRVLWKIMMPILSQQIIPTSSTGSWPALTRLKCKPVTRRSQNSSVSSLKTPKHSRLQSTLDSGNLQIRPKQQQHQLRPQPSLNPPPPPSATQC